MEKIIRKVNDVIHKSLLVKWNILSELDEHLSIDPCLDDIDRRQINCICYAPNVGYRSWIFRYKGVFVALFDVGNGHYSFHTAVTMYDVFVAIILTWFERSVYKYDQGC